MSYTNHESEILEKTRGNSRLRKSRKPLLHKGLELNLEQWLSIQLKSMERQQIIVGWNRVSRIRDAYGSLLEADHEERLGEFGSLFERQEGSGCSFYLVNQI